MLIFGNTAEAEATEFCQKNIVGKFTTVECHSNIFEDHMDVGCLHMDTDNNSLKKSNTSLNKNRLSAS